MSWLNSPRGAAHPTELSGERPNAGQATQAPGTQQKMKDLGGVREHRRQGPQTSNRTRASGARSQGGNRKDSWALVAGRFGQP